MQATSESIIDYTAASSDPAMKLGDDWETALATDFDFCSIRVSTITPISGGTEPKLISASTVYLQIGGPPQKIEWDPTWTGVSGCTVARKIFVIEETSTDPNT